MAADLFTGGGAASMRQLRRISGDPSAWSAWIGSVPVCPIWFQGQRSVYCGIEVCAALPGYEDLPHSHTVPSARN